MKKTLIFFIVLQLSLFTLLKAQESRLKVDTLYYKTDTMQYSFVRYTPENAQYHFQRQKPDSNDNKLLMSVVAAFTSKRPEHIVGTSVSKGNKRVYPTDAETAYCLIIGDDVSIESLENNKAFAIERAVRQKGDYFQQMHLVENGEAKQCEIFKNRATFRRALVKDETETSIIETLERMTIDEFIKGLIELDYQQAIYLDMGSWSEGWYKDDSNNVIRIGNNWKSSHLQTNWLVIRKK
ncbi:MAG: hypothetical protein J6U84_06640 [Bacteroidales bacterium]|jgi:hypothetical protein|nr:hypothetical protein [Bacteroidales bacterium]